MAILDKIEPGLPAELLQRTPRHSKAYFDAMSNNAQIGVAVAERLPQLTIRGDITVEARNVNVLYSSNSIAHNVGAGLSMEHFELQATQAKHRDSRSALSAIVVSIRSGSAPRRQEVESALVEYTRQRERVRELQKVTEATARSVEISLIRYEQNLITFDRVLDSQRSLA